jgi:hypothetical protein
MNRRWPGLPFAGVQLKRSAQLGISPVDAYKRLVRDRNSRLGWRILLYLNQVADVDHILERTLIHGEELCELLTEEFKEGHLAIADLLLRFRNGDPLSQTEEAALQEALQVSRVTTWSTSSWSSIMQPGI